MRLGRWLTESSACFPFPGGPGGRPASFGFSALALLVSSVLPALSVSSAFIKFLCAARRGPLLCAWRRGGGPIHAATKGGGDRTTGAQLLGQPGAQPGASATGRVRSCEPAAVAVGMWESRAFCGISKRCGNGGKVALDVGLAGDIPRGPSIPSRIQRNSAPGMSP